MTEPCRAPCRFLVRRAALPLLALLALGAPAEAQAPLRWDGRVLELAGRCNASAAVALPPGDPATLLVANDEDDRLEAHALRGAAPALTGGDLRELLAVGEGGGEADLEGAAWLGGRAYWIGSHGRNSSGERQPRREQLVATEIRRERGGIAVAPVAGANHPYRFLVQDLRALPLLRDAIDSGAAPERGGLNIEGLAAGLDGRSLLLGLRSPLGPGGRAIIVPLPDVAALFAAPAGTRAQPGAPILLDLDRRGIRDIALVPPAGRAPGFHVVLAGTAGDGDDFALFRWSGRAGERAAPLPGSEGVMAALRRLDRFRPEAVIAASGGRRLVLLSDDGDRQMDGERCAKLPRARERFRAVVLTLG